MSASIHQAQVLSGRSMVLAVTIALHMAAISGLMYWRITEVADTPSTPIDYKWFDEQRPVVPPSEPETKVKLQSFTSVQQVPNVAPIPPEETVPLELPREDITTTIPAEVGPVAVPVPADTPLQFRAVRPSDDYYPPHAIRMGQDGIVIVRTCVDASGRLTRTPQVVTSSRSRLLDDAAVSWASEALRFTPATRGGAAVSACKDFRVNFTLH